ARLQPQGRDAQPRDARGGRQWRSGEPIGARVGRAGADAGASRRGVFARAAGGKTLRLEGRDQQQRRGSLCAWAAQETGQRADPDRARPGLRGAAAMIERAATPPAHSLRRRLLVLAAIAFASVLQASSAYRTALQQADTMFDYHLQELARSLQGGARFTPEADPGSADRSEERR